MIESAPRFVVFCRLDDSPFDPYRRAVEPAAESLAEFGAANVAVVFFSGRTRAELELVQEQLGIRHPFVAENGGAVFAPRGYWPAGSLKGASEIAGFDALVYGTPYVDVVAALRRAATRSGVHVVGFNDMSVLEVASELGVSSLQARLAKLRDFEEPFRVVDDDTAAAQRLQHTLLAEGFHCRPAGRFLHVGMPADTAVIVEDLLSLYGESGAFVSIGIGDPDRDHSLLRRADISYPTPEEGSDPRVCARAILRVAKRLLPSSI